jgi:poly(3-hydroxybutyrate) depolymerase
MAVFLFVGCSETDTVIVVDKNDGKGLNTANENALTLEHNGLTREYILFVPNTYDSATPLPLLFNFMVLVELQANTWLMQTCAH